MKKEEEILVEGGLTEDEAYVYNTLLEKGAQKASQVAKWTGINRTLVYKALDKLESMGAVEKTDKAQAISIFKAAHPSAFVDALEKRKEALERSTETFKINIGPLISRFNLLSGKPNVQFFEGMEGALTAAYDSLQAKGEILTLIDAEKLEAKYVKFNEEYVKQRIKRNIPKRIISPDTPRVREIIKKDDATITDERVIAGISFSETLTMIYNNKVCFITLTDEKKIATIVEDSHVANMHREIFEFMWRNSTTL